MKNLLKILIPVIGLSFGSLDSSSQKIEKTETGGFKEYNKKGQIEKEVETIDNTKIQMEYEYNTRGEIIQTKRQEDYFNKEKIAYGVITYSKYKKGKVIEEKIQNDMEIGGIIERADIITYKYDKKWNLVEKKRQEDLGNDKTIEYSQTEYFKYDETGKVIEKKLERDLDGNGTIDETKIFD